MASQPAVSHWHPELHRDRSKFAAANDLIDGVIVEPVSSGQHGRGSLHDPHQLCAKARLRRLPALVVTNNPDAATPRWEGGDGRRLVE